jgi:signal transduction histidine kinase
MGDGSEVMSAARPPLLAAGILVGARLVARQVALEILKARTRGDLVMGVSHDLRTPLASMKILAESLYLGHVAVCPPGAFGVSPPGSFRSLFGKICFHIRAV